MTTSNARKLNNEKNITMTSHVVRKNNLMMQKLVGILMLVLVAVCFSLGGHFVAAGVIAPFALVAVFSKQKVLDFGIFSNEIRYYK